MRVWLDDVRPSPLGFDIHCKTAGEAVDALKTRNVTFISFDHDLGSGATGYSVASFVESCVALGLIRCPDYAIHSSNPVGRERIRAAMEGAKRIEKMNMLRIIYADP